MVQNNSFQSPKYAHRIQIQAHRRFDGRFFFRWPIRFALRVVSKQVRASSHASEVHVKAETDQ